MTAPEVARAARVPVASINALMRRDSKRSEYTEAILSVLPKGQVNLDWVRTGFGSPDPTPLPDEQLIAETAHEKALLRVFRALDAEQQLCTIDLVRSCAQLVR